MKSEEQVEVEVEVKDVTPSSSPPTPPSPLPISVGPGNSKYYFSSSPSASPPFSPLNSSEKLPFIIRIQDSEDQQQQQQQQETKNQTLTLSTFSLSLDQPIPASRYPSSRYADSSSNAGSNCLQDLLEWFVIKCCSCWSLTLNSPSKLHHRIEG